MPADEKRRGDRELAELAALADGSLPPARREALERRVAASPRLQSLLREQQAALAAVRARDERAPQHLRESISGIRQGSRTGKSRILRTRVAVGAVAAAAVAVLVLLALPDSETALPTLAQAAAIAARPATAAQPSAEAWGLEYPDLTRAGGWRATGSRTDRIGDRTARTVFYVKDARRIAYTILSTGPVRIARGTHTWRRKGRPWYGFEEGGRTVVAWERKGHMCVVSANGLRGRGLVELITR